MKVTAMPAFARFALASVAFAAASLTAAAAGIVRAGDVAPAFTSPQAAGGTVDLARFHGKPIYINFFASWCGPCNDEAPSVGKLYAKYKTRGLNVIGVDELESKDKALGFAKRYRWPFTIADDDNGTIGSAYGALGLPVHVFIGKDGKVSTFRLGEMDPSEIEAAIKKIL